MAKENGYCEQLPVRSVNSHEAVQKLPELLRSINGEASIVEINEVDTNRDGILISRALWESLIDAVDC